MTTNLQDTKDTKKQDTEKKQDTRIKNPRIKWGLRGLFVLIILALASMAYFYIKGNELKNEVAELKVFLSVTPTVPSSTPEPTNTPIDPTNTPVPTSTATATPTSTPEPTNTPEPTDTPMPTSTATPTSTPIPLPELKVENWWGELVEGDLFARLWYPDSMSEGDISFRFIDQEGDPWPYHTGRGWVADGSGRVSIPAYTDCYMPFGLYTVEAYNGKELLAQTKHSIQHNDSEQVGRIKTISLDEAEGFTKSEKGWTFGKKSNKRDDTYLLGLIPREGNDILVQLTNLGTKETLKFPVNTYELVRIDLIAYFYNKAGEVVDVATYGFTVWPSGQALVVEGYPGESKRISVILDEGKMNAYDENLPRYWNPYILPDGTFVTMERVNPTANEWLVKNKRCPSEIEYPYLVIHSEAPKTEPEPTFTPIPPKVVKPPVSLVQAPFEMVSKLELPASYLSVSDEGDTLKVSNRGAFPLATCGVGDGDTLSFFLTKLRDQKVTVWLWEGFAHTFESQEGVTVWAACDSWVPPAK